MNKIFGIGANGLVGSRITELLVDSYPVTNLSLSAGVNITKPSSLSLLNTDQDHQAVILFAAKADVDGCEKDKPFGENGDAWKINVAGVQHVVDTLKGTNKTLIYISTDFVFDGENTPVGGYSEEDTPRPVNWYAETKLEGENIVRQSGITHCILRIAYPYRNQFEKKKDFVHAILDRLRAGLPIKAVTDHTMTPTFVDDIALAIQGLLKNNAEGTYHVVGSTFITPYDAVMMIGETYGVSTAHVEKTTREEFFKERAKRPFDLSLKNDKIVKLGAPMKTFLQGLHEIKQQENL